MTELRKRSRCRSEILLKYFAINRKGEHNKTCETCLNKIRKPVSTRPSDFNSLKRTDTDFVDGGPPQTTEQTALNVDSEMLNTAVKLLETYSTRQLNQLMSSSRQPHLMAYVEYTLNREEKTVRNMSIDDVFPLIIELNGIADHPCSNGGDTD